LGALGGRKKFPQMGGGWGGGTGGEKKKKRGKIISSLLQKNKTPGGRGRGGPPRRSGGGNTGRGGAGGGPGGFFFFWGCGRGYLKSLGKFHYRFFFSPHPPRPGRGAKFNIIIWRGGRGGEKKKPERGGALGAGGWCGSMAPIRGGPPFSQGFGGPAPTPPPTVWAGKKFVHENRGGQTFVPFWGKGKKNKKPGLVAFALPGEVQEVLFGGFEHFFLFARFFFFGFFFVFFFVFGLGFLLLNGFDPEIFSRWKFSGIFRFFFSAAGNFFVLLVIFC